MTPTLQVRFDVIGQPRSQVLSLTRQMSCLCVLCALFSFWLWTGWVVEQSLCKWLKHMILIESSLHIYRRHI